MAYPKFKMNQRVKCTQMNFTDISGAVDSIIQLPDAAAKEYGFEYMYNITLDKPQPNAFNPNLAQVPETWLQPDQ